MSSETHINPPEEKVYDVHVLTIFPEFFAAPFGVSVLGKALERGLWRADLVDIRDFATDKHKMTDDTPYGGGAGMVMKPGPVVRAMEDVDRRRQEAGWPPSCRIALTPGGERMSQDLARELAELPAITLVCGRYEGFDDRAMAFVDREVSLGDFVLTGGEPAALAVVDAVVRLLPGVLGNAESPVDESFTRGLLEYPHYTRPAVFRGQAVPEILKSGDHGRIARWRRGMALLRTLERRPDLLEVDKLDDERRRLLDEALTWQRENTEAAAEAAKEGE